jgi:multiple sugar transport system ATP-binding protein
MNRFDAAAERDGIRVGSVLLRPSDAQLRAAAGHGKLVAGVRPEHLSIGDGSTGGGSTGGSIGGGQLTVEVALVEDLGSDSYVYGHLADDPASSVIVRSGRQHPRPGEVVKVAIDTGHLHLFDAGTGLRIGD